MDAKKCGCWDEVHPGWAYSSGVCNGTKERDACDCGGDERKCDFYPERREKAGVKMAKFPTYEELGRQAAEYALDSVEFAHKTIREWVSLIIQTADEPGFDIGDVLMQLRNGEVICGYCDHFFHDGCERGDDYECETWSAAQKAAEMIEHLYAASCAKSAEISLLTRDRDDWKRRAHEMKPCGRCENER